MDKFVIFILFSFFFLGSHLLGLRRIGSKTGQHFLSLYTRETGTADLGLESRCLGLGIIELENKQINNRKCDTYSCGVLTTVGFEWGEDVCCILRARSANPVDSILVLRVGYSAAANREGELSKAHHKAD